MIYFFLIFGAVIGCLCGMAVYNQIEEWKDSHK